MESKNIFYIGNIKYEFNLDLMRFIDSTELMNFLVEKESVVSRSVTDKETEVKQFLIKKVQALQDTARSSTPYTVARSTEDNEFTIDMLDRELLLEFTISEVQSVDHTFLYSLDTLGDLTLSKIVYEVIIL